MTHTPTRLLLNFGHAIDHMVLLIFATAVTSISQDFGLARWEDLMPYSAAAFFFFGVGSLPAGRLGDRWGRRPMMVVYFIGLGISTALVGFTQSPMQMAVALSLLGCFAAIYHPVGIPMLVQGAARPGWIIGVNGLAGNLGVASAAIVTGFLVKYAGWRAAFWLPGALSIALGWVFLTQAPTESQAPAQRRPTTDPHSRASLSKIFIIMTLVSTSSGLIFNFATSSNYEMLAHRLADATQDPALLGTLLAIVYATASLTQLVVGRLIDRYPLKTLYLGVVLLQACTLLAASFAHGWAFFVIQFFFMAAIFGAVPFTDALIVRHVDDAMRSRVSGMRLAVSLGASSLAVWLIGPVVKEAGFTALLLMMTAASMVSVGVLTQLPTHPSPRPA